MSFYLGCLITALTALFFLPDALAVPAAQAEDLFIDAGAATHPFPHFWEQMFGSGRAILSLRESYRNDLRAVKQVTDFRYVRFHAILHDEVGTYNEDEHGNPVYNFAYVDQIYDGLLHNGVRPVVEISFMPKKLAFNPDALHPFWYKPNVSPPKSWSAWDGLVTHLAQHLVDRYGINEVAQWYFEVWNEPNIDFWGGIPRQKSYFELYEHTARDLKVVNTRLRVGGPATAAAAWVGDFLKYTAAKHVPVDFVSSHGYADDTVEDLFGTDEVIPEDNRVCRAIDKVRRQIAASDMPKLPLLWTEWNVQGKDDARDTSFVGTGLANTIRMCDGLVDMMSFWTFSDVFEEGGPMEKPFDGAFGLRAKGGINKPSYYEFALLHQLGDQRILNPAEDMIVTKRDDGTIVLALWNLVDPGTTGTAKKIRLTVAGVPSNADVAITAVDQDHSDTLAAYKAMGSPVDPTEAEVELLNQKTRLATATHRELSEGKLELELRVNALFLVEISPLVKNQKR